MAAVFSVGDNMTIENNISEAYLFRIQNDRHLQNANNVHIKAKFYFSKEVQCRSAQQEVISHMAAFLKIGNDSIVLTPLVG